MQFLADIKNSQPKNYNFAYSFRPIYYISRAVGLLPFKITYDSNGAAQIAHISLFDGLWFAFSVCTYLTAAFRTYKQMSVSQDSSKNQVINFGFHAILIEGLIVGAVMIALDVCNRQKYVEILKKVSTFDNAVSFFKLKYIDLK